MDGQHKEAAAMQKENLEKSVTTLDLDSPNILTTMKKLAFSYWKLKRTEGRNYLGEDTLMHKEKVLSEIHKDTLFIMNALANSYLRQKRFSEGLITVERET
jgi:hypothetical protein